jgi:hypothetical protein
MLACGAAGVCWRGVNQPGSRRLGPLLAAVLLVLIALWAAPAEVDAQPWDPAAAIAGYSAALNAHDVAAALDLFDQYGSATDAQGHHFEGRDGLTTFLLANGFSDSDLHVSTENIHVVANRAVWTYTCSCAAVSTDVRIVLNHDKISVFAVIPPASASTTLRSRAGSPQLALLLGLGLGMATLATALILGRSRSAPVPRSSAQGHLLIALMQARQRREAELQ